MLSSISFCAACEWCFYFMLLRNIHLWIKTGTTPTQKRQETDYPFRKSSILCCSGIKCLEPRVSQFWAMKETNNKNLCCSGIIKYFCAAQKSPLLFRAAHWNKQKYISMHFSCSGMIPKGQTVQGERVSLKLGIWRVFPKIKATGSQRLGEIMVSVFLFFVVLCWLCVIAWCIAGHSNLVHISQAHPT